MQTWDTRQADRAAHTREPQVCMCPYRSQGHRAGYEPVIRGLGFLYRVVHITLMIHDLYPTLANLLPDHVGSH